MTDGLWVRSSDGGAMLTPQRPHIIVAEITRAWVNGQGVGMMISERFELVLNWNRERGYRLQSFVLSQLLTPGIDAGDDPTLTETIVAVFERQESQT